MTKRRPSSGDGALARSIAYALGKVADVMVQNPVATGMTALALNYAAYKLGFWDGRAEYNSVWQEVTHPRETVVDPREHLLGYWQADQDTAAYPVRWRWWRGSPSYPLLWRWSTTAYPGGLWQWIGTREEGLDQPWPPYSGTYDGELAAVVNPVYTGATWQWIGTQAEGQGQVPPSYRGTTDGDLAPVTSPLYAFTKWFSDPAYNASDPGNGGVNVYCPVHKDYGLLLVTQKPDYYENGGAIPAKVYAIEQAGHLTVTREAWTETVKVDDPTPHYYNYYFEPLDISGAGVSLFNVTKGEEVTKYEAGARTAMLHSVGILLGSVLWARYNKANYSTSQDTAMLQAITSQLEQQK